MTGAGPDHAGVDALHLATHYYAGLLASIADDGERQERMTVALLDARSEGAADALDELAERLADNGQPAERLRLIRTLAAGYRAAIGTR